MVELEFFIYDSTSGAFLNAAKDLLFVFIFSLIL